MNRGKGSITRMRTKGQHGYTIVEVLIFLAVSAVLFASTMLVLSGRQQRVQFTNAVRDFETEVIDIANDVSNGYYQSAGNVGCDTALNVSVGGVQGTNKECVMLGRVIKFGFNGSSEQYGVYSIVGKRQVVAGTDVTNLIEATPKLLLTGNASDDQTLRTQRNVGSGSKVRCIGFNKNFCVPATDAGTNAAIAFVTKINGGAKAGTDGSGITADIYYVSSAGIADSEVSFIPKVTVAPGGLVKLPAGQMLTVCLESGGTQQYALVRILNGRVLSEIKELSGGSLCS